MIDARHGYNCTPQGLRAARPMPPFAGSNLKLLCFHFDLLSPRPLHPSNLQLNWFDLTVVHAQPYHTALPPPNLFEKETGEFMYPAHSTKACVVI